MSSWFGGGGAAKKQPEEPESWEQPGSPDYYAVKIAVLNGRCAQRNEKKNENPDPYILITYGKHAVESKEVKNTVKPKWDEVFEFPIPPTERSSPGELALQMWDRNNKKKLKGQVFLGEVRLHLSEFANISYEYVGPRRYRLQKRGDNKKDRVDGELNLKVGLILPEKDRIKSKTGASSRSKFGFGGGDPTTEDLLEEAEEVVDESFESSKRSLQIAENTRNLAAETLENLAKQGDQLRNVQGDIDSIDDLQDQADKHMRAINSIGGVITNKFRIKGKRQDHVKKADKIQDQQTTQREIFEEEQEKQLKRTVRTQATRKKGPSTLHLDNDPSPYQEDFSMLSGTAQQKISETDRNIERIGDLLDDMKLIALDMGDEIDDHNRRLDILHRDVDKQSYRMKQTNRKIKSNLA